MLRVNIEDVAAQLKTLLERVAGGEEVILVNQDREVARLVPPSGREEWLRRARQFRGSIQVQGEPLSTTVVKTRQEERN